jgi:hypothetical protein
VSLEKVGNAKLNLADKFGAIAALEESLAIRRTLADRDKDNARRQWDVLLSLEKVGNAKVNADDACGALAAFGESLAIARKLLQTDEANIECERDVSATSENLENTTLSFEVILRKILALSIPKLIAATRVQSRRYRRCGSAFLGRAFTGAKAGLQGVQHSTKPMKFRLKRLLLGPSTSPHAPPPDGGSSPIPKRNGPNAPDSWRAPFQHEGPDLEHSAVLAPMGKETTSNDSLTAGPSSTGSIDELQDTTSVAVSMVTGDAVSKMDVRTGGNQSRVNTQSRMRRRRKRKRRGAWHSEAHNKHSA